MIQKTTLIVSFVIVFVVGSLSTLFVSSGNEDGSFDDITFLGLELEKLISFINGLLALALFIITFTAFRREHRERMLYVSAAFALFAVRNFLFAHELFVGEVSLTPLIDPISTVLDFVILLTFFFGLLKK